MCPYGQPWLFKRNYNYAHVSSVSILVCNDCGGSYEHARTINIVIPDGLPSHLYLNDLRVVLVLRLIHEEVSLPGYHFWRSAGIMRFGCDDCLWEFAINRHRLLDNILRYPASLHCFSVGAASNSIRNLLSYSLFQRVHGSNYFRGGCTGGEPIGDQGRI